MRCTKNESNYHSSSFVCRSYMFALTAVCKLVGVVFIIIARACYRLPVKPDQLPDQQPEQPPEKMKEANGRDVAV